MPKANGITIRCTNSGYAKLLSIDTSRNFRTEWLSRGLLGCAHHHDSDVSIVALQAAGISLRRFKHPSKPVSWIDTLLDHGLG